MRLRGPGRSQHGQISGACESIADTGAWDRQEIIQSRGENYEYSEDYGQSFSINIAYEHTNAQTKCLFPACSFALCESWGPGIGHVSAGYWWSVC